MFQIYKKKIFICSKSMCHVGFILDSHGRSRRFCITYPGTLWPHLHSSAVPVTSTLSLLSIWVVVSVPGLFPPNKVWPVPHFPLCLSLIFLQSGFFLWKWLLLMRNPGNCQGEKLFSVPAYWDAKMFWSLLPSVIFFTKSVTGTTIPEVVNSLLLQVKF